ncbi:MAG TPA: hypothetical protein VFP60_12720 [Pseudolabrys sp.]|nr:hypothetical protein [Pseudolabrys sp.]
MNLRHIFGRRPAIATEAGLAEFIDENAAFLVQKGLYEYSRARAGHYAKILFAEECFRAAIENSRWRAFPLGLAMLTEMIDGVLRPHANDRRTFLDRLSAVTLSVFDRYPAPAALGAETWSEARGELLRQIEFVGMHPAKAAKDIPIRFCESYFALMPIHEKLRASEFHTISNYLRVTMCNIHHEFTTRMDAPALARELQPA